MTSQTTFTSCMHDQMLESNRDDVKLEAMRCVTVMTAKGKLSVPRTLFPHIVKNVSSKNPELKKLIYLYLTNFADQEPDLALLPVATLQKSLKNPNPLIRSSALKVLTSMRLNILSAILMATLKNSINDLSPYVRKTVAHSIIKIYRLDSSLKEDLIEYIERLFDDKNSMVLSSAVATFEVVCPERLDLVQKHYRRFCFILADCNEWGQAIMLKLLVRYILKTCKKTKNGPTGSGDQDPKILLRSAKPLLHSNNSSVVVAVVRLHIELANHNEIRSTITKPLIRLLNSRREIQLVVLGMIDNLTAYRDRSRKDTKRARRADAEMFRPYIKSFFIKHTDCTQSRLIKLKILTNLSSPVNVSQILRELQAYISTYVEDKVFVSATIHAIGRCANLVREVAPTCLNRLTSLLSNNNEHVVSEAIVVLRSQINRQPSSIVSDENYKSDDELQSNEEEECDGEANEVNENDDNGIASIGASEESEEDEEDSSDEEEEYEDDDDDDDNEEEEGDEEEVVVDGCDETEEKAVVVNDHQTEEEEEVQSNTGDMSKLNEYEDLPSTNDHNAGSATLNEKKEESNTEIGDHEKQLIASNNVDELAEKNGEVVIADEGASKLRENQDGSLKTTDDKQSNENSNAQLDEDHRMISTVIKQVSKLLPTVTAPQARATILWILAEFCDKNLTAAKCAPNVLRSIAKTFCQEDNFVKLQSLTLVSKFLLSLDKEAKADLYCKIQLIASYLFSLAKYDINHDVRDRGRFLKKLLENEEVCGKVLVGRSSRPELAT